MSTDKVLRELCLLPRLDHANVNVFSKPCKICGSTAKLFDVVDFNKSADAFYAFGLAGIEVPWLRCENCGFLFTSFFDDWTHDDFARFIYNSDYLKIDPDYEGPRAARLLEAVPTLLGRPSGLRILDYGSGKGIFVRGLRENGYEATAYDPFSASARPEGKFDLITCFEVIEHSPDPMAVLRDMRSLLTSGGGILLGETLQPPNIGELRCSWWYCAPRNGHCSTFTARSLALAAQQVGYRFCPGGGHHAFVSPEPGRVTDLLIRITGSPLAASILTAPIEPQAPGWHEIERSSGGAFRWTAAARVIWRTHVQGSGVLEIRIPVRDAISADFLPKCTVLVDGAEAAVAIEGLDLIARTSRSEPLSGSVTVELRTPEPQSPRTLRGVPDDRPLGLAVAVL